MKVVMLPIDSAAPLENTHDMKTDVEVPNASAENNMKEPPKIFSFEWFGFHFSAEGNPIC